MTLHFYLHMKSFLGLCFTNTLQLLQDGHLEWIIFLKSVSINVGSIMTVIDSYSQRHREYPLYNYARRPTGPHEKLTSRWNGRDVGHWRRLTVYDISISQSILFVLIKGALISKVFIYLWKLFHSDADLEEVKHNKCIRIYCRQRLLKLYV